MSWHPDDPDKLARAVERWRAAGATHLTVDTMYCGLATVDDHLHTLGLAAQACDLRP